jgi:hypothetical protein
MSNATELLRRALDAWDLKDKAGEAAKTFAERYHGIGGDDE